MGISKKKKRGPNLSEWDLKRSNQYYVLEGRANMQLKVEGDMVLVQSCIASIVARYNEQACYYAIRGGSVHRRTGNYREVSS